ncbi:MAG: hypothetical protein ACUVT2_12395 [Thiobacillaceae bacterium]
MTGMWLVSFVILWALVLVAALAILALARESAELRQELEMLKCRLAHGDRGEGTCRCQQSPEPGLARAS